MTLYLVSWEIEVDAETPEEAAKLAREIQLYRESTATFFRVKRVEAFIADGEAKARPEAEGLGGGERHE